MSLHTYETKTNLRIRRPVAPSLAWPGTPKHVPEKGRATGTGASVTWQPHVERTQPESSIELHVDPASLAARRRWEQIKKARWPDEGREERIARGLAALDAAIVDYGLDADTARWIAEDADLEDM